jgi:glycosyltransferase involved in cell wall biosynthesis
MAHFGIDHRLTYYRKGGISTYMTRLTQSLAELDRHNRYTVFHSRKDKNFSPPNGFRAAALWTPCHHRYERTALSVELARFRLDVLHSPDFIPPYRGAKRHVITVHDLTFMHYPQHITSESRRYYNVQIDYAVRHADHILTDSESSKRDMVNMLGVAEEKITVHILGVEEHFTPPTDEAIAHWREKLHLPEIYWLFLGTFEPRKNIIGLLEAYSRVRTRLADAPPLILAGTRGWLYEESLNTIDTLKLTPYIWLLEDIPRDALPTLYHEAIALVTPSFYEGFGLPALEAMASGTVPIVSNRSSLPEVVGNVGLQVEPEDIDQIASAMLRALQDSEWRQAQQAAGRTRAANFTWQKTAETALHVYETLV